MCPQHTEPRFYTLYCGSKMYDKPVNLLLASNGTRNGTHVINVVLTFTQRFIPVFCHNMSGYDPHLFLKTIGYEERKNCIPHNYEKYITFSRKILVDKVGDKFVSMELRFLDSYKFMGPSLNKLASYLPKKLFIKIEK